MMRGGGYGREFRRESSMGRSIKWFWVSEIRYSPTHRIPAHREWNKYSWREVERQFQKKKSRFWANEMIERDLAEALEPVNDHDETTCSVCYEDYYGRPPENPEDYKYGKRYTIIKEKK